MSEEPKTKRRGRKLATKLPLSNISDETIEKHVKAYAQAKSDAESANGVVKATLKAAKRDGIDPTVITLAYAIKKREPEDVDRETRLLNRVLLVWKVPVGSQIGLFDDGTTVVDRIEQGQQAPTDPEDFDSADEAERGGFKSYGMGMTLEDNPWPSDSLQFTAWAKGWERGRDDVAERTGQALGDKAA